MNRRGFMKMLAAVGLVPAAAKAVPQEDLSEKSLEMVLEEVQAQARDRGEVMALQPTWIEPSDWFEGPALERIYPGDIVVHDAGLEGIRRAVSSDYGNPIYNRLSFGATASPAEKGQWVRAYPVMGEMA